MSANEELSFELSKIRQYWLDYQDDPNSIDVNLCAERTVEIIGAALKKIMERSPDTTGPTALTALNGLAHRSPGIAPSEATALNPSQHKICDCESPEFFHRSISKNNGYTLCIKCGGVPRKRKLRA